MTVAAVALLTIVAHEVQPRFVVVVQAVDSYCDPEHSLAHAEHPLLVKV